MKPSLHSHDVLPTVAFDAFRKRSFQLLFQNDDKAELGVTCHIMTTLTSRNEIVKTNKIIGSELTKIQRAFYDEDILQYYKDDNEEHLYWEQFDFYDEGIIDYETYNKIIGLKQSDVKTFTDELTKKLIELFNKVGATEFYVISHLKLDFFGNRENKFKPLLNSYEKLEKIVGQKTYKEAFKFSINSLPDFIEILFWITRSDPSVPEFIFLFDQNERLQINLCKYGNIHLTEFKEEKLTNEILTSLGWNIIEGEEFDNFTEDGKIKGRKLKI